MEKLLVICGQTATGKTSFAIDLAKKLNGEIVSADSRQVYAGLDIGTGKDLPANANFVLESLQLGGYYTVDGVKIWGYDLAEPEEEFSVYHYFKFADKIIKDIISRNKVPILVGGTGLYIKAVVDGIHTMSIPRNPQLRKMLGENSRVELFEKLAEMDALKAASMNASDKKNPRRLIRAIEVAESLARAGTIRVPKDKKKYDTLLLCFYAGENKLKEKINKRVDSRLSCGIEEEVKGLIKRGVAWDDQSMTSTGYKEWREYFDKKINKEDVVKEWKKNELKYAKRQKMWFKKDKRLNWVDVSKNGWHKRLENLVRKWYS